MPVPEFDEGSSWQTAVMDPLSDQVSENIRIHAQHQHRM